MSPPVLSLTERQRHALRSIVAHIDRHGVVPSAGKRSQALGLSNTMATYLYLNSLGVEGRLRREHRVVRRVVVLRAERGERVGRLKEAV